MPGESPMRRLKAALRPFVWHVRTARERRQAARLRREHSALQVIAVAGSCGKTTTKELVAAVLATRYRVVATPGNWNALRFGGIAGTVRRFRPEHEIAVVETAIEHPGDMARIARVLKPDAVIMLAVAPNHLGAFGTLERIEREKSVLVRRLPPSGVAFLNTRDPRVARMAKGARARVVPIGGTESDIVCERAQSRWPEGLALDVRAGGERRRVETRLLGHHWAPAVLAALAVGRHFGVPLENAAAAIREVPPPWARLQPIALANGVTFIRDEYHGSKHNYEVAFEVVREARAARKVLVSSYFANAEESPEAAMRYLGREAARLFDRAHFVDIHAGAARDAAIAAGMDERAAFAHEDVFAATEALKRDLRAGDLVLLKGRIYLHLSRIYLAMLGEVRCRRHWCEHQYLCDRCRHLGFPWRPELEGLVAPPGSWV